MSRKMTTKGMEPINMTKQRITKGKEPMTVVSEQSEGRKGGLKRIGGSQSNHWNVVLANQVAQALWMENSDTPKRNQQLRAVVGALAGIEPKDEIEGMLVANLIAAHNAAMECYRRAMIDEQTFMERRENLNQANKLSRTCVILLEALNKHRGKSQQKVTVKHVHVHAGGQAVVGSIEGPGGGGRTKTEE